MLTLHMLTLHMLCLHILSMLVAMQNYYQRIIAMTTRKRPTEVAMATTGARATDQSEREDARVSAYIRRCSFVLIYHIEFK